MTESREADAGTTGDHKGPPHAAPPPSPLREEPREKRTHILNGSEQRTGRETRNLRDWKDQRESRSIDSWPVSDEMVTSLKRRLPACQSEKRRLGLLQHQVLPRAPDDCRSNMSSRVLCMGGCPAETGSKTDPGKGRSRRKKV